MSNPTITYNLDQSNKEYNYKNVAVHGQIYLQVVDMATGNQPVGFTDFIISLDIEEMDSKAQKD
jgi:hypothetical protein